MTSVRELLNQIKSKSDLDNVLKIHGPNYQDSEGNSFLHEFARNGNVELMVHLFYIEGMEKCDVNIKDNKQRTALFDALNEEIVEILLIQRIDYVSSDSQGKKAEEVNEYVNFVIKQKCNETKKRIMLNILGR